MEFLKNNLLQASEYVTPKLWLALTKPEPLQEKWYFLHIRDFEATRQFLEALKTAGDIWDLPLQDSKHLVWFIVVDL